MAVNPTSKSPERRSQGHPLTPAPVRTAIKTNTSKPVTLAAAPKKGGGGKANKASKGNTAGIYGGPLYDPSQDLVGKDLATSAKQIAGLQVNAPIADQRTQINQNNKTGATQQHLDFGYYMKLAGMAKDAVGQQQQEGSALQGQLAGINSGAQSQIAALGAQAQGGTLGRLDALGLDGGQTGQLAAQTAQQQGVGLLNGQTAANFGALQSAGNIGQTTALRGATSLKGVEQIGSVARATALANLPLNQKIADLQASRGQLTATALGQLRQNERNYQISEQGLTNTANATAATTAQNKAKNALALSGQQLTAKLAQNRIDAEKRGQDLTHSAALNQQDITDAKNVQDHADRAAALAEKTGNDAVRAAYQEAALRAKVKAAGGGVKLISGASQARLNGQITQAEGFIQTAQRERAHPTPGAKPVPADLRAALGAKFGYPKEILDAAYELLGWGAVTPRTATALRNDYGLKVSVPVRNRPNSPGPATVDPVAKAITKAITG